MNDQNCRVDQVYCENFNSDYIMQMSYQSISISMDIIYFYIENCTMFLSSVQYLQLTDKAAQSEQRSQELEAENEELKSQTLKMQATIQYLQNRNQQLETIIKQEEETLTNHITTESGHVKQYINNLVQQQKEFIIQEMLKISQEANVRKINELKEKIAGNRIKDHEMKNFYDKVKKIYQSWQKTRKEPTCNQLLKWIEDKKVDNVTENDKMVQNLVSSIFNNKKDKKETNSKSKLDSSILGKENSKPKMVHNPRMPMPTPNNRNPRRTKPKSIKKINSGRERASQENQQIENSSECTKVLNEEQSTRQPLVHNKQSRVNIAI